MIIGDLVLPRICPGNLPWLWGLVDLHRNSHTASNHHLAGLKIGVPSVATPLGVSATALWPSKHLHFASGVRVSAYTLSVSTFWHFLSFLR